MIKRVLAVPCAALGVVTLSLMPAKLSTASFNTCDPQYSILCHSLLEWWDFEESTGNVRAGYFGSTPLYERPGQDVPNSITIHKFGSSSLQITSSQHYVYFPRNGNLPGYSTVAVWIRLAAAPSGTQPIVATSSQDTVINDGQVMGQRFQLSSGKPQLVTYEEETGATLTVNHATALSADGNFHLVVFTLSPYGPYGKARGCISLDGGAFTCGSLTYNMKRNFGDLTIGSDSLGLNSNMYIDGLGLWARAWDTNDVAFYYNSGSGRAAANW